MYGSDDGQVRFKGVSQVRVKSQKLSELDICGSKTFLYFLKLFLI